MKKGKTLLQKLEKLANEMVDEIDTMEPQKLLNMQSVVKTCTDLLTLKNKIVGDEEAGKMFSEED